MYYEIGKIYQDTDGFFQLVEIWNEGKIFELDDMDYDGTDYVKSDRRRRWLTKPEMDKLKMV